MYHQGDNGIDVLKIMDESCRFYMNAFWAAWMPYHDSYAKLVMPDALDMIRVRNGAPNALEHKRLCDYLKNYPHLNYVH